MASGLVVLRSPRRSKVLKADLKALGPSLTIHYIIFIIGKPDTSAGQKRLVCASLVVRLRKEGQESCI